MARSNGDLPTLAVSRAMLATAPGRQKRDLIFDAPDPKAFVRRLPAEDLYFAIKEIGLHDAAEIVALASPGQFQTFVDLDVWQGYQPDPERILLWLQLVVEGASSAGVFRELRTGLDSELILLVLKSRTTVHPLEEGEDPVLTSDNWIRTAEGKYLVEIHAEGDEGVMVRRLLEDFIEENPFEATRYFEAVRWEQASELEETALRWRTGRLRDIGFPDLEEAIRIWTPLPRDWKPREAGAATGTVAGVPALLLSSSRESLFLDRIAANLPDGDRPRFNEGLIYLLNCALVADGIDPKDLDFARGSLQATRDMLSLGLELASDGAEDLALRILATTPAVELFRLAVTTLVPLAREAREAVAPLRFGTGALVSLDSPEAEILSAVQRRRPRLYDPPRPGEKASPVEDFRAFRTREDLTAVARALSVARLHARMLTNLSVDVERFRELADAAGRAITATTANQVVLTAVVRALLGKDTTPQPLAADELTALGALFESGALSQSSSETLAEVFGRLADGASDGDRERLTEVVDRQRLKLDEEIGGPAAADSLDARFVECVLVEAEAERDE